MAKKKYQSPAASPVDDALQRLLPLVPADEIPLLLAEMERPLPTALRVNPLKVDTQTALADWSARYGWQTQPVPFCPTGWWIPAAQTAPSQTIEHRLGDYYIMDAASMLPVELFDLPDTPAPLALDLAASPGGKTTHLAARLGDRGLVLANDSSADRLTALRLVLQTWGATSAATTNFPGERFGGWFPETFDLALLDAPCSMQGLRTTESHPMRAITAKERQSLAVRQTRLLESALRAVRVGGQVVYSTCTLSPEEDEGVLEAVLTAFPGAVQIEDISQKLGAPAPGLSEWEGRALPSEIARAVRLWPHRLGTAGFFAARLTKLAAMPGAQQDPPARSLQRAGLTPLGRKELSAVQGYFNNRFGFDLQAVLDERELEVWRLGSRLLALPLAYLRRFAELPVQSAGLLLAEEPPAGLEVSHDWAARFGDRFTASVLELPADLLAAWLRGEDVPAPTALPDGLLLLRGPHGELLGRARCGRGRLKNLLPRRATITS